VEAPLAQRRNDPAFDDLDAGLNLGLVESHQMQVV
jgi:hypothetical protein